MTDNTYYHGFKIGDRVTLSNPESGNEILCPGMCGTIVNFDDTWFEEYNELWIGVCWDEYVDGHSCNGKCEWGHGWNVNEKDIMIVEFAYGDEISVEEEPSATDFFLS